MKIKAALLLIFMAFVGASVRAEEPPPATASDPKDVVTELILDASGSMKQKLHQRTKLLQAKRVLRSFMLESANENRIFGLRVYGQKEKDCKDSKLALKFGDTHADAIESELVQIDPPGYGKTPLAFSLEQAAKDLAAYPGKSKRVIVVTDGTETCGGDPCRIAAKLKASSDIKIYVVGYTVNEAERRQLSCLSDLTGGKYFDAQDAHSLIQALGDVDRGTKNLFVKSPEPLGMSVLWKMDKAGHRSRVAEFVSSFGTQAEPEVTYEVVVALKPNYRFTGIKLAKGEKRTLVVGGKGTLHFQFMRGLFTLSVLNEQGKAVAVFPSDEPTEVPVGHYKIKASSPPFAEAVIDDVTVAPGGLYEESIKGFGAIQIDEGAAGIGPFGIYVFDDRKKLDLGSYLTGMPLVLPFGRYTIKSVGNALLKNVYPERTEMRHYPLPEAGKTITFTEKKDSEN